MVAKDPDTHLLFSRYELQELVGVKGALFITLGMHETTNFQSNLDNSGMDVSKELLDVLTEHGKITFLQLYVDSPHTHLSMPYKHPVWGNCHLRVGPHQISPGHGVEGSQLPQAHEGPDPLYGGSTRLQD